MPSQGRSARWDMTMDEFGCWMKSEMQEMDVDPKVVRPRKSS